jgi:hypothetical protein
VIGNVAPATLNELPETFNCVTVVLTVPEFVRETLCVLLVPAVIVPNARLDTPNESRAVVAVLLDSNAPRSSDAPCGRGAPSMSFLISQTMPLSIAGLAAFSR